MIIHWNQNPLYTGVELDDRDIQILKLRIKIERLEDILGDIEHHISPGDKFDLEKVRLISGGDHWDDDKMDEYVQKFLGYAKSYLESHPHCGDCTCQPASCSKCWAECLLDIDTIEGCNKYMLHKIDGVFGGKGDGSVTIEEATDKLKNYEPKATWEGWEAHVPRWKAEANRALEWLIAYRDKHFPTLAEASRVAHECDPPERVHLYDEEGVEGWRWSHPDGREWSEVGTHDESPPRHPVVVEAESALKGQSS